MTKQHGSKTTFAIAAALIAVVAGQANAGFATFDSLTEGAFGNLIIDGGITFSMPQNSAGGGNVFTIERADATLGGSFFSPQNVLTMGGITSGPSSSFPAVGSFKMTTGGLANAISLEMFYLDVANAAGNVAELNLFLGGSPVGSTSLTLPGAGGQQHQTLSISGIVFDEARIEGTGAFQGGAFFAVFDNVRINQIPEPGSIVLASAAVVALTFQFRKRV